MLIVQAIAPAIALLAVAIAALQWWNGRQQLVLNLFEKRFQVFMDVRQIASEAIQGNKIVSKGLTNEVFARGQFLFGPELVAEFTKLHALVGELETGQPSAAMAVNSHFEKMIPLFEPYLKMTQRMPSLRRKPSKLS